MYNIIFDATILLNSNKKDASRGGAFFVAQNIFYRVKKSNKFKILTYYDWSNFDGSCLRSFALDKDAVNDFKFPLWKISFDINTTMWRIHEKLYHHTLLRKPFALGILVSKFLMKRFQKFRMDLIKESYAFISPLNSIPTIIRKQPHLLFFTMLYDAIPFWFPEDCGIVWTNELYKVVSNVGARDYFFCDSRNSFLDFHKINPKINEGNTKIVLLAASKEFCDANDSVLSEVIQKKINIPDNKKYVFCLSSVSPRKNIERIVWNFVLFVKKEKIKDLVIVVSGSKSENIVPLLKAKHPQEIEIIESVVIPTGYIEDSEKVLLYQHALFFVYTSQYEGFGLPPLEAMQCGCPVVVSNNSSLPEVVGDAGIMIDWDSDEQHVEAYKKIYNSADFRQSLKEMGLKRAKLFDWDKSVALIEREIEKRIDLSDVGCPN